MTAIISICTSKLTNNKFSKQKCANFPSYISSYQCSNVCFTLIHEVTFPPNYVDLYEQKPKAYKSFGIRISPLLESANIKPQNIEKHFTPNIPAWCMKPPEILFDLHSGKKSGSNPHILKDDFRKMQSRYKNYQQIYTDGSKEDSKVCCAVISDNHSNMQRIPDDSSIFTAWERSGSVLRVLDSRPKGRGFEPHRRHCVVVLEQDTFILA